MPVGLRLRDTGYDSLRFDSQSKATGYNYYFFVLFLRAGVNYMLVGLRLRDTRYDSLRFDSQSKATGDNY